MIAFSLARIAKKRPLHEELNTYEERKKTIEDLFAEGRLYRISELEFPRYVNFF